MLYCTAATIIMYCVTIVTCVRVIEPNLYIGTQSGDTMSIKLEDITDTQLGYEHWVFPHKDLEKYHHRQPVLALVGAYGTMGCQGNLMRLFSSPEGVNHHSNMFRQEIACSLALSIGYGYQSPWSRRRRDDDGVGQSVEEQDDNDLCILVHLVC